MNDIPGDGTKSGNTFFRPWNKQEIADQFGISLSTAWARTVHENCTSSPLSGAVVKFLERD